jgi:hypothetical protein
MAKKNRGIERKVLVWDMKYRPDLRGNYWTFVVVGDEESTKRFRQKAIETLNPTREYKVDSGETEKKGAYVIFSLLSALDKLNPFEMYDGIIRRDESLREKKTTTDWNSIVNKAYRGTL